jgi:hypothetical protein
MESDVVVEDLHISRFDNHWKRRQRILTKVCLMTTFRTSEELIEISMGFYRI